jgi:hypothetical protein
MALTNTEKMTEHFDFGSASTDFKPTPKRTIQRELKGEIIDQQKEIDAFEQAKGWSKKPKVDMSVYEFQSIVLDPEKQHDNDMLSQLLNNEKYIISYYKDNWTPQGTYRAFIIYGKKKEEPKQ